MVVDARSPAQPDSRCPTAGDGQQRGCGSTGSGAPVDVVASPARTAGRPFDGDMVEHCGCFTDYVGLPALGQCPHQGWKNTHRVEPIDTTGMPTLASAESSCWSNRSTPRQWRGKVIGIEWNSQRRRRKPICRFSFFPRMPCRNAPFPTGNAPFHMCPT